MKKILIALIILCLCLSNGLIAFAETDISITHSDPEAASDAVSIVDWTAADTQQYNSIPGTYDAGTGGNAAVPVYDIAPENKLATVFYPRNVETVTENGVLLVKKTFEVSPDVDPQVLVQPFEQDGYSFYQREILRQQLPGETQTQKASKTAIVDSDNDDKAEILKQFPASIEHEENGFTGQLFLDVSTIITEAEEYETYTYSYTKTKEISLLDRNDPSYISKDLNGMRLTGVSFTGQREELVGNSLVPTQYSGVAKYTGTAVGKRPTSYITTAIYCGELTKSMPGNILYTVVYVGKSIEPADENTEQPQLIQEATVSDTPEQVIAAETGSANPRKDGITPFCAALIVLNICTMCVMLYPKLAPLLRGKFHKNKEEREE